jgi:hypothetical protein
MNNSTIPSIAISVLSLVCLIIFFRGLKLVLKRTGWSQERQRSLFSRSLLAVAVWIAIVTILALKDFFADFSHLPPRPLFAILLPLPFILIAAFSKTGTELLRATPSHWLIYMQTFRIAVEILLWIAFIRALLPVQMTFEGRNFDVLSGILALPAGWAVARNPSGSRLVAIIYNLVGLLLLINILVIAVLSMPTSLRYFMNEPANTIVAEFPFIYLPAILVLLAYTLHIFSLRQQLAVKPVPKQAR